MADHFVKLWASILDSSVWREPPAHRLVWITMLAMKDKHGFVGASIDGLARRANVSEEDAASAVASFLAPDPRSRNQENEGRRIKAVPRGWHILNHEYFTALQDKEALRAYEAERKAEQRRKLSRNVPDTSGHARDTDGQERDNRPAYTSSVTSGGESTRGGKSSVVQKPDDVPEQVWEDWTAHRRKKRATVTPTVLDGLRAEAAKAGLSVTEAMTVTVTNGWQGFRADWMTNGKWQKPAEPQRNVLPENLRPAIVMHEPGNADCLCDNCCAKRRRSTSLFLEDLTRAKA